jgi:hypothetical protein
VRKPDIVKAVAPPASNKQKSGCKPRQIWTSRRQLLAITSKNLRRHTTLIAEHGGGACVAFNLHPDIIG